METLNVPILIPAGMLRISRDGEADRVIYPVHADGWRQQGWTVHPPQLELDEGEEALADASLSEGERAAATPELVEPSPVELDQDGLAAVGRSLEELVPEQSSDAPVSAGGAGSDVEASFEGMTKAQIIAAVDGRHGVKLDPGMTRSQLIAAAQELEARATTATASVTGSTTAGGGADGVRDVAEQAAGASSSAEASGVIDDGIDALIPTLL